MNEQNLDYLNRQIKFTGFGESHANELKAKMESGISDFILLHNQEFGKDMTTAGLHFRKSDNSDLYFFNKYDLLVKNSQQQVPVKQTFYVNQKEDNITLKEGYNLLSGRAIQKEHIPKEGEKYKAWLQLDFKETDKNGQFKVKQFHPNYGYDLETALHKHPIQELSSNDGIKRLLESLERGNRQQVTYGEAGKEQKVFLEASPQFKSINFFDSNMNRILASSLTARPEILEATKQQVPDQSLSSSPAKKETAKSVEAKEEVPKKQKKQKIQR
jgi:hypothetical protein